MSRSCPRCEQSKPLDEFRFNAGTGHYAKLCNGCWTYNRRTDNVFSSMRNLLQKRVLTAHRRAKTEKYSSFECTITIDSMMALYEKQGGLCAVTGLRLTHNRSTPPTNVSIDRIDNNRGYVDDNVRLVCSAVNLMQQRLSDEETAFWCEAILKGMGRWR